ncbi:MAG: hypothetical protein JWR10_635 [Rubritepida sp.]|nr:hypothetical protein [Rubritepida sp.]
MTNIWVQLVLGIAVPALLILSAPTRWLGRTAVLWLIFPVIFYIGMILWEVFTRPWNPDLLKNAFYGFMIISPLAIVPWMLACVIGFAIGFGLRRLLRPGSGKSALPVPLPPAPIPPPAPIAPAGSGWRSVHLGFANDGLKIGACEVWTHAWRATGEPSLHLPHPAHPSQTHRYDIYEVGDGLQKARFAAGELSNGVWGFYVAVAERVEVGGVSADGSLRYEHRLGDSSADTLTGWVVLIDVATGQVLADCAAWPSSRITGNADGSLFLLLGLNGFETLFRIDPAARTFRDQGMAGPDQPLSQLSAAVEQARRAPGPLELPYRRISPDGTIRVDLAAVEWRNSQWVHTPRVIEIASGRVVLDLWNTDWDATVEFPGSRRVRLDLRRFHEGGSVSAELDLARGTYRIVSDPAGPEAPLAGIAQGLENAARIAAANSGAGWISRYAAPIKPHPLAAWRAALLILAGAIVAIGGATYLSIPSTPPERTPLSTVPGMKLDLQPSR